MNAPTGASSDSDRLLAAARAGESAALGQLAERYRPYLRSVAARLLDVRLPSDCSSVVQEALLAAVRGFAHFRGQTGAEFLAWLAQIVRNEALTRLRRAGTVQPLPPGPGNGGLLAADAPGPDEQVSWREQAARVMAALDRLPPDYREVIALRNLEGLSLVEVALRMQRSHNAVRQLWVRAVRRLRQECGDQP
jgi:RNA polymerase sigma-70 factor (ECF subfamily)